MVPDQKEGTGLGCASLSATDERPPEENGAKSTSVPRPYGEGMYVFTVSDDGGDCQSNADTPSITDASMDPIPCMGALTCAAS